MIFPRLLKILFCSVNESRLGGVQLYQVGHEHEATLSSIKVSSAQRTKLDYMISRGPFQPTVFCDFNPNLPLWLSSVQLTFSLDPSPALPPSLSFTTGEIKSFSIRACAHILMKGYTHSTAIQVEIFPASRLHLFCHIPEKCFKSLP